MTIRVLVVDDHPIFRDGLAALVSATEGFELSGIADDGKTALAAAQAADVVLMDLNLPGMSGVEATRVITSREPAPAVLVVTMVDDDDTVIAAMQAGARGYVLKGSTAGDITAAVRTVAGGESLLDPRLAAKVMAKLRAADEKKDPLAQLTAQEHKVLDLIGEGLTNRQIAERMFLAEKTGKNYVSALLAKLGLTRRVQAAVLVSEIKSDHGHRR